MTKEADNGILLSWSSGKDSALALREVRKQGYKVSSLITVLRDDDRVSVHGVHRELLRLQSLALNLPLIEVQVTEDNPYENAVSDTLLEQKDQGIVRIAYGDLFLEDIKAWRDRFHAKLGFKCLYPVWKSDTKTFAQDVIDSGYKAVVTCVDVKRLDLSFTGRDFDAKFLKDLPEGIDPCGENGEFHTFVYDGPEFHSPIPFTRSEPQLREFNDPGHHFNFGFCDLSIQTDSLS